jgi:hypothetical protein
MPLWKLDPRTRRGRLHRRWAVDAELGGSFPPRRDRRLGLQGGGRSETWGRQVIRLFLPKAWLHLCPLLGEVGAAVLAP